MSRKKWKSLLLVAMAAICSAVPASSQSDHQQADDGKCKGYPYCTIWGTVCQTGSCDITTGCCAVYPCVSPA